MKVKALKIIGYRSIENTEVVNCGNLNVFIGKNNAGKSNVLAAIELIQNHLSKSTISSKWSSSRPVDEFFNREIGKGIKIAVEFELQEDINGELRNNLQINYPNLERAAGELESFDSVVFILSGHRIKNKSFIYTEQIVAGQLKPNAESVLAEGISLLNVSKEVAYELFEIQESLTTLRSDVNVVKNMALRARDYSYLFSAGNKEGRKNSPNAFINNLPNAEQLSIDVRKDVQALLYSSDSVEEFTKGAEVLVSSLKSNIDNALQKETSKPFTTFAGETKTQPEYVGLLMNSYGSISLLHLRETKTPIGREEASALLKLKITRGGPERLKIVQNTVRSLLGVDVDAFQSDEGGNIRNQPAEMDVDQFLAEANGAGVREALRLILDLELKQPKLVLIEEPEVHLHPGLEYAMYSYLRDKSKMQQIFVTTHSTNFVDSVSFQNIYLVARDNSTKISIIDEKNGALKIPTSLGLRLSTVFMYDRLLFVEGPSDEAVLREFARLLSIDLAGANMNFVQMGGVNNFAHYAAENTLSLLSRRNLKLWFLTDRDERSDDDVQEMLRRLGGNAQLIVTELRDLENCLLSPPAVHQFIANKLEDLKGSIPSLEEVEAILNTSAVDLKEEVINRRVNSKLLKPIYLQNRKASGSLEERLQNGISELQKRLDSIAATQQEMERATIDNWTLNAKKIVPGAEILDKCCQHFGTRFQKDAGDSAKLASYMTKEAIPREIINLLKEVTAC